MQLHVYMFESKNYFPNLKICDQFVKQECIPVGCVPSAGTVVSVGGRGGASFQGGVLSFRGGVLKYNLRNFVADGKN